MRNVLVTGLPRSGTTLTCELLNLVPATLALDEPMTGGPLTGPGNGWHDLADNVERFVREVRVSVAERGVALSRQVDGRVRGEKFSERDETGTRQGLSTRRRIQARGLPEDFTLVIKHNAAFAAGLSALAERFPMVAIVRHPLAILASWQTVPMAVARGRVPAGEHNDPLLREALDGLEDPLDRQIHILRWFFDRYLGHLPREAIVRYEDIIASGGAALAAVTPAAAGLRQPLTSRNTAERYGREAVEALAERLAGAVDPPWARLYPTAAETDAILGLRRAP